MAIKYLSVWIIEVDRKFPSPWRSDEFSVNTDDAKFETENAYLFSEANLMYQGKKIKDIKTCVSLFKDYWIPKSQLLDKKDFKLMDDYDYPDDYWF